MTHKCNQEKVLELILKKIDKLEEKIDNLLQFKWKVLGFVAGLTLIATLLEKFLL